MTEEFSFEEAVEENERFEYAKMEESENSRLYPDS